MFDDDSMIRRVNREGVLLLGGGRALLMQLAHPLVARGVAEHSDFRADKLGRLHRTLEPTYAIVFGTPEEAHTAAARIAAAHERVRGAGYRAADPELLLWVQATLIDTSIETYARFVGPLGPDDRQRYYQDAWRMAELLGVTAAVWPTDYVAFEDYISRMIAGLTVSDDARRLAAILFGPEPAVLAPALAAAREVTAELLPPSLRRQYGFRDDPARGGAFRLAASLSRTVLPHLPPIVRRPPARYLSQASTLRQGWP